MDYYGQIAKGYDGLYGEEQLSKLSIIKNSIRINKKTKLLDVGCGTGVSSGFECFVAGIDKSIELLRLNKNSKKVAGAAECLPFKKNAFDCVVSVTSIHNFKNIGKSISEMKRVGKCDFVFSILKKSKRLELIKKAIRKGFYVEKAIDEGKDIILFCKTNNFKYIK